MTTTEIAKQLQQLSDAAANLPDGPFKTALRINLEAAVQNAESHDAWLANQPASKTE